jgi:hypothetical protein
MLKAEEALKVVARIDLSPINRVLKHENPEFWTESVISETEMNYRRLLALFLLHPGAPIVVNKILDDYWHQHILDTKKYAEDCDNVFGYFLHHDPYFGINGELDRRNNQEAFALTQDLWANTFGSPMISQAELTLDKILGFYATTPREIGKHKVYAFPQTCQCGKHCNRSLVPEIRINPQIAPEVNPQPNPQIRPPVNPQNLPTR